MCNKFIIFAVGALFASQTMAQDINTEQSNHVPNYYTVSISMETHTGEKISNSINTTITCEARELCGSQLNVKDYLPSITPSDKTDKRRHDESGSIKVENYVYFDFNQPSQVQFRYSSAKLNPSFKDLKTFGAQKYDGNNINGVASLKNLDKEPLVIKIDAPVLQAALNLPVSTFGGNMHELNTKSDNILTITIHKIEL